MSFYITSSPAKINLYLHILNKRKDGYHNISSLVQKITLFDTIFIEQSDNEDIVSFSNPLIHPINNTVYKALKVFKEYTNITNVNFSITVLKNIPTEAGLGGGSSNAGTVLKILNKLCNTNLSYNELLKLAIKIGSDVPLFISSQNQLIIEGKGDILRSSKNKLSNLWILLIKPNFSISTEWAYKNLNFELTNHNKSINRAHLQISDFVNDLEKVVINRYPLINNIKNKLKESGAILSLMSGSGSTIFGIFESKYKLYRSFNYFNSNYQNFKYFCCRNLR